MTINRKNYLIVWGILLSAALAWSVAYWYFLPHLPDTYSGEAVHGKVIDADTGEPVAGAIVIGLYELSAPYSMEGGIIAGHMHVEEVVTDVEGNYWLAAWGPKPRYGDTYLDHAGPKLLVFRQGYAIYTYSTMLQDNRFDPVQTSLMTGGTIQLERFEGDRQAYAIELTQLRVFLESLIEPLFGAENCAWKQVPRIMMVMDEFSRVYAGNNMTAGLLPDIENLSKEGNCGTRDDFIREYQNEIMDDKQRGNNTGN